MVDKNLRYVLNSCIDGSIQMKSYLQVASAGLVFFDSFNLQFLVMNS